MKTEIGKRINVLGRGNWVFDPNLIEPLNLDRYLSFAGFRLQTYLPRFDTQMSFNEARSFLIDLGLLSQDGRTLLLNDLIVGDPLRYFGALSNFIFTYPEIYQGIMEVDIRRSRYVSFDYDKGVYKFGKLTDIPACVEFLTRFNITEQNPSRLYLHILDISYLLHFQISKGYFDGFRLQIVDLQDSQQIVTGLDDLVSEYSSAFIEESCDPSGRYRPKFLNMTYGLTPEEYLAILYGNVNYLANVLFYDDRLQVEDLTPTPGDDDLKLSPCIIAPELPVTVAVNSTIPRLFRPL